MNGTVPVPVFVLEDILRDRDFYRDTDRSKYELLITFIHIVPHRDIDRDSDRYCEIRKSGTEVFKAIT